MFHFGFDFGFEKIVTSYTSTINVINCNFIDKWSCWAYIYIVCNADRATY